MLAEHDLTGGEIAMVSPARMLLVVRAHIRAAGGHRREALADAREAARRDAARGGSYLLMGADWSSALALHAAGAGPEARAEAERERELALTVDTPAMEGVSALVLGLVGEPDRALGWFEQAAAKLEGTPRRLDHARALVELGAALRRANRRSDARDPLQRGMELAHRCGAHALAERARDELRACGARPRKLVFSGVESLTASERRVARMAAGGMTNVEIAQALFITKKTVETHIGRIYRKLDVGSRNQLEAALAARDPDANGRSRRAG